MCYIAICSDLFNDYAKNVIYKGSRSVSPSSVLFIVPLHPPRSVWLGQVFHTPGETFLGRLIVPLIAIKSVKLAGRRDWNCFFICFCTSVTQLFLGYVSMLWFYLILFHSSVQSSLGLPIAMHSQLAVSSVMKRGCEDSLFGSSFYLLVWNQSVGCGLVSAIFIMFPLSPGFENCFVV